MDPNTKPSALTTGGGTQDPAPLVDPEADTTTLSCLDIEREARAGCPLTPDTARRHAGLARRGLVSPCESADLLERMADALEEAQRTTAGADWAGVDRMAAANLATALGTAEGTLRVILLAVENWVHGQPTGDAMRAIRERAADGLAKIDARHAEGRTE